MAAELINYLQRIKITKLFSVFYIYVHTTFMLSQKKDEMLKFVIKYKNLLLFRYNPPPVQWKADIVVRYFVLVNSSINFIVYCMMGSRYFNCLLYDGIKVFSSSIAWWDQGNFIFYCMMITRYFHCLLHDGIKVTSLSIAWWDQGNFIVYFMMGSR